MAPTLLVQGFQRAFVDVTGPTFSVSASMRRTTCEDILKFARAGGWTIIHSFLDPGSTSEASSALEGFSPRPGEAYIRQRTLSPFRCAALAAKLPDLQVGPVYLMSLAGVGVIGATFFDALERGIPLHLISNAIADSGRTCLSERRSLAALEDMAGAFRRTVHWPDFAQVDRATSLGRDARRSRMAASAVEPLNLRAQELTALIILTQYLLDHGPAMVAASSTLAGLIEDVLAELEVELDRARKATFEADGAVTAFGLIPQESR